MDVQTYLDSRYTGEVITSKRALCAMKRKGLIMGYSDWGYLESGKVWYISTWMGEPCTDYYFVEFGREPKKGEPGSYENPFPTPEALWEAYPRTGFYYKGNYFRSSYLDGCLKPYLIKSEPPHSDRPNQVRRTMSVYGAVM